MYIRRKEICVKQKKNGSSSRKLCLVLKILTPLRKELGKYSFEGVLVDEAGGTLLLEAAIDELNLLFVESRVGSQGGQLLGPVTHDEAVEQSSRTP